MRLFRLALVPLFAIGGACSSSAPASPAAATYANCGAVQAAGKAPIHKGDPGYSAKLDRDGDGVACDTKMTFAECQKSGEYPGGRYAVEYDNGVCTVQRP